MNNKHKTTFFLSLFITYHTRHRNREEEEKEVEEEVSLYIQDLNLSKFVA